MDRADRRKRNRPYRAAVAAVLGLTVAWIVISVVGSVAWSLWGYAGERVQGIRQVPYTTGGDNRASLDSCRQRFRWLFDELRAKMLDVAPEDLGGRGETKWRQWVAHLRQRLEQERARCHLAGKLPDPDDAALRELADVAEAIENLTDHYAAKRERLMSDFREELVALEGLFGRLDARIEDTRRR